MNEQQLHEIAVAYAQVKLRAYQEEHKDAIDYNPLSCDSNCFAGPCLFCIHSI